MPKIKLKSKQIRMPESFEAVKEKQLTRSERDTISKKLILRWYMAKKFEKLKGLQTQIIEASYSEREKLKEDIIKNTAKQLEDHKKKILKKEKLTTDQIEAIKREAKLFAEDIINVAEGHADIALVARRHSIKQEEEHVFNNVLDGFVGSENQSKSLQKIASKSAFQKAFMFIKQKDPAAAKHIEAAMKEGDYKTVREQMVKHSDGLLSKDLVNRLMALSVLGQASNKEVTGWGSLDTVVNYLNTARYVGFGHVLNKASKDMKIPFMLTIRLASFTLRDLRQMDEIMDKNKHLLENKKDKTVKDHEKLSFIESVKKIRQHIEGKINEKKDLNANFKVALKKHLDTKKDLSESDKREIMMASKFEDLRLIQMFDLFYGGEEDREKWLTKSLSRIPTIIRAVKNTFGEQRFVKASMLRYHAKRMTDASIWEFRANARNWDMGDILRDIDSMESKIKKSSRFGTRTPYEDLFKEVKKYNIKPEDIAAKRRYMHKELFDMDRMVQKYHYMVRRATQIMSDRAKQIVEAGTAVQKVQQTVGGPTFLSKDLNHLPHLSDDTLKTLGLDPLKRGGLKGADVLNAYTRKLVDAKTMESITRARFSALGEMMEKGVAGPVSTAWSGKVEVAKGAASREAIQKQLKGIDEKVTPGRAKYNIKRFGLPAIILGVQGYSLFTGKAKGREVLYDLGEAAAGFVPFLGTSLDIRGVITGTTLSGKKLSSRERWMYAGFAAIGVIADAATLIGGLGLGLRAGLGGVRAGRRAVKAGALMADAKKVGNLSDIAHAKDLPFFQRHIAKAGSAFNSVRRADSAAEAMYTKKAIDQANEMSRLKVNNFDDLSGPTGLIKQAENAGNFTRARDLRHLYNMHGGINYMKTLQNLNKGFAIPKGFFSRALLKTKGAYLGMKAKLLAIGIPAATLKKFEDSFDVVTAARKAKLTAVNDLHNLTKLKEAERITKMKKYQNFYNETKGLHKDTQKYAKVADDLRKQSRLSDRAKNTLGAKERHLERVQRLFGKSKASKHEVDAAQKAVDDAAKLHGKAVKKHKKLNGEKKGLASKIAGGSSKSKKWKKEFDGADRDLMKTENQMFRKEESIRNAEERIVSADSGRAILEMEIASKATRMAKVHDSMSTAARLFQYGGLAMGGIWFLTGFKYGPTEQLSAAKTAVVKGAKYGGKAAKYLYLEDHSGKPAIDQLVEDRVRKVQARNKLNGYITKSMQKGEKPENVLAKHWNTDEAKEIARKQGLYQKVQKLIADKKIKPKSPRAGIKDIATGDSARKLREKITG
ncbi:hypothetical protein ACFL10_01375 [Patescibacteria group bacterium]